MFGFNKANEEVAIPLLGGQDQVGVPQVHHLSHNAKEVPARADVALASVPEPKGVGGHVCSRPLHHLSLHTKFELSRTI